MPTRLLNILIKQIQDCRDIAAAANQPFSNEQILNAALHLVNQTGYYHDDVREWRQKAEADKTWANFKAHFLKAQEERNEEPTTANQAGYNAAAEATMAAAAEALANLATTNSTSTSVLQNSPTSCLLSPPRLNNSPPKTPN
jgi:hypothetical protein